MSDSPNPRNAPPRLRAGAPIVVGTDGSAEATRGVLFAADLAVNLGAELTVVHALGMYDHSAPDERVGAAQRLADAEARLDDDWCAPLDHVAELTWSGRVVHGAPIDSLLRVADEVDASLIVLGSHGAGGGDQPLLGSTSHWVVRNSNRPVVIVPPGDNHPHRRLGAGAGAMNVGVADS